MSKICVSGGCGFIGSHLVDRLIESGHTVWVIDNLSSGKHTNNKAKYLTVDIGNNFTSLFEREKFDYVFHLAAQINLRESFKDPYFDAETNILGSLNLIQNSIKTDVKKFIFASTGGAIYNPTVKFPWTEESETVPQAPYGLTKLTVENYLRIFSPQLNSCTLRFSNVYGKRQNPHGEAGVIAIFMENAKQNKPLKIFGTGEQTRDFVHVSDIVSANIHAMENDLSGTFNVSGENSISVNEIAETILDKTKSNWIIEYLPAIPGELMHTRLSSEKLQKTGWKRKYNFVDGLEETLDC